MCEFILKIYNSPKVQSPFPNILARKYTSKRFQMRLIPTMEAFYFWKNLAETMVQIIKVVFVWFLHKSEAYMVVVCLIWDLTSKSKFWALNQFWGIYGGLDGLKTTLNFWSIINFEFIFAYFQNQRNSGHFTKPVEFFGIDISKFYNFSESMAYFLAHMVNSNTSY